MVHNSSINVNINILNAELVQGLDYNGHTKFENEVVLYQIFARS